jgi:virginiamycin A acetyltransferase
MRKQIKQLAFALGFILALPGIALIQIISACNGKRDAAFEFLSQLFSLVPGKPGNYIRAAFYHFTLVDCSADVVISFNTLLFQYDTKIGQGVYIGPQCNIGKCTIGENTLLGSGVHIMSGKEQHRFDSLDKPIKDQGGIFNQVHIGKDCWIGNGTLIMANVGNHSIVGAGSVVTNDLPDYSIATGNPARVIKSRDNSYIS